MKKIICFLIISFLVFNCLSAISYTKAYSDYLLGRPTYERGDLITDYFTLDIEPDEGWIEVVSGQLYLLFKITESGGTKWNPEKEIIADKVAFIELNDPGIPLESLNGIQIDKFVIITDEMDFGGSVGLVTMYNICRDILKVSDDTNIYIYNKAWYFSLPVSGNVRFDPQDNIDRKAGKPFFDDKVVYDLSDRIVVKN